MSDDKFKSKRFDRAEASLLAVINWMEGCRKDNIIANLTENKIDKLKIIHVVFDINANINPGEEAITTNIRVQQSDLDLVQSLKELGQP